jgi:hypothetical protein
MDPHSLGGGDAFRLGTGKKPCHYRACRAMFSREARELHGRHGNCTVARELHGRHKNCTVVTGMAQKHGRVLLPSSNLPWLLSE